MEISLNSPKEYLVLNFSSSSRRETDTYTDESLLVRERKNNKNFNSTRKQCFSRCL
jgi:hypothetical protein